MRAKPRDCDPCGVATGNAPAPAHCGKPRVTRLRAHGALLPGKNNRKKSMSDLLWQKPGVAVDARIQAFLAGDDVLLDREFFLHDIRASHAHAQGLERIGILSAVELEALERELEALAQDFSAGGFVLDERYEDGHSAIEARPVERLYRRHYAGEPLVEVVEDAPWVSRIAGRHGVQVGGFTVAPGGRRVVVVATLDNLLKGAATQAMQNLNLALGFDEFTSIPLDKAGEQAHV